jgi:hypothetical protein
MEDFLSKIQEDDLKQKDFTEDKAFAPFEDSSEDELGKKDENLELLRSTVAKKLAEPIILPTQEVINPKEIKLETE